MSRKKNVVIKGNNDQIFRGSNDNEKSCFGDCFSKQQDGDVAMEVSSERTNIFAPRRSADKVPKRGTVKWRLFNAVPGPMSKDMVKSAKNIFEKTKVTYEEGHCSWKFFAYLGGMGLCLAGLSNVIFNVMTLGYPFGYLEAIFDVYMTFFGLFIVCLEHKVHLWPKQWHKSFKEDFYFLVRPYGRGLLYIFLSTLLGTKAWSQTNISNLTIYTLLNISAALPINILLYLAVSSYLFLIGLVIFCLSARAHQELESMKSQMKVDTEELKQLFSQADKDWSGYIDSVEFILLLKSMHINFTHDEVEFALLELDENRDGVVSFEEFSNWYERI